MRLVGQSLKINLSEYLTGQYNSPHFTFPLHRRFPAGVIRITRRAKGAGPTRGDRHGKDHQQEIARGYPRVPRSREY